MDLFHLEFSNLITPNRSTCFFPSIKMNFLEQRQCRLSCRFFGPLRQWRAAAMPDTQSYIYTPVMKIRKLLISPLKQTRLNMT